MTMGYIDFHCHVLPKMDDGSDSTKTSVEMLRQEAAQGVETVVATPHFYPDRDKPDQFLKRRDASFERIIMSWEEGLPWLCMGAEVAYFTGMGGFGALRDLCIEGTNVMLLEMPFGYWSESMIKEVVAMQDRMGLQIVLAHIERYMSFQDSEIFERLSNEGILFQVNAGGFLRLRERGRLLRLMKRGYIDVLGSDSHNLTTRPPDMGAAVDMVRKKCGDETVSVLVKNARRLLSGAIERGVVEHGSAEAADRT